MALSRWLPVHPARWPNDSHWQVSWLPDQRFPAAFPRLIQAQWHLAGSLPGHSCGGSGGVEPLSLLGPPHVFHDIARTTRDVAGPLGTELRPDKSPFSIVFVLFRYGLNFRRVAKGWPT